MTADVAAKRAAFRALHAQGCFVLPNPWDVGGIRRLERRGFRALATTSSGFAASLGLDDGEITLDDVLSHMRAMSAATDLPVNADFENGFADDPAGVARNVTEAVSTGVAGVSIEDRERLGDLYAFDAAVERVAAAREAIARTGDDVLLIARCEAFLTGRTDLDEVIARLRAFAAAGADCVYAPGVLDLHDVRRIVDAVAPVPVNVLLHQPGTTVAELASAGARRVSIGGGLARAAWRAFDAMADALVHDGRLPER
ncbi:MAG TPA: isocitrate lyase/phosphoenolpyruvate mutase family protein [Candidatus Baltobacteraceae bacterium]|nr:isocitrate lyase/phosphoenolpyruvate mutase family protein [Candidatus Baltobacteraceae bacterium]